MKKRTLKGTREAKTMMATTAPGGDTQAEAPAPACCSVTTLLQRLTRPMGRLSRAAVVAGAPAAGNRFHRMRAMVGQPMGTALMMLLCLAGKGRAALVVDSSVGANSNNQTKLIDGATLAGAAVSFTTGSTSDWNLESIGLYFNAGSAGTPQTYSGGTINFNIYQVNGDATTPSNLEWKSSGSATFGTFYASTTSTFSLTGLSTLTAGTTYLLGINATGTVSNKSFLKLNGNVGSTPPTPSPGWQVPTNYSYKNSTVFGTNAPSLTSYSTASSAIGFGFDLSATAAASITGTTTIITGNITDKTVTFNQSTAGTYSGVVSGNSSLTKLGTGTVALTGANTYSGGTTVSAGALVGTTTSLQGAVTNNAAVKFDQSTTGTYGGVMSGSGSFEKLGTGTVALTGANTYSGGTTISGGTLAVSGAAGALTANSPVNINGGTLLLSGTATDRINNAAAISLGADTGDSVLRLSGDVTETLGAMTLTGTGTGKRVIDFGATSGALTLASLSAGPQSASAEIWNWSKGADHLMIAGGLTGIDASDFSFYSGSGSSAEGSSFMGRGQFVSGRSGELVPVPEASTLMGVLGLMAPLAWRERRHWMRCRAARG